MAVDLAAAETFIHANARLLERRRLARLLHGAPVEPLLRALHAYSNPDGGFGNALEPDVRAPDSETTSTLAALDILAEIGAPDDPSVAAAAAWIATVADPDGGVPFVLPAAAAYPHAPWMVPSAGGSHLTPALAARLLQAGADTPWLTRACEWCWAKLERPAELSAYWVKFSLDFLDHVGEEARALEALDALRPLLGADGSLPVAGGTADERLTALSLSPQPGSRSRALFTAAVIEHCLDGLEQAQQDDGGWTFDWLAWSPGQAVEWRGVVTVRALATLRANGRAAAPPRP